MILHYPCVPCPFLAFPLRSLRSLSLWTLKILTCLHAPYVVLAISLRLGVLLKFTKFMQGKCWDFYKILTFSLRCMCTFVHALQ